MILTASERNGVAMSTEKILDGRLATIAAQRYLSDKLIRDQFSSASDYYEALERAFPDSEEMARKIDKLSALPMTIPDPEDNMARAIEKLSPTITIPDPAEEMVEKLKNIYPTGPDIAEDIIKNRLGLE